MFRIQTLFLLLIPICTAIYLYISPRIEMFLTLILAISALEALVTTIKYKNRQIQKIYCLGVLFSQIITLGLSFFMFKDNFSTVWPIVIVNSSLALGAVYFIQRDIDFLKSMDSFR
ncbi:MAG: hypothetical protein MUE53_10155 [Chitinophagales bacterium]|nr:hypothetical protein [Chitinophagales bacterium]